MKLFVAIVNYGRSDLTIDCLRTAVPEARAMIADGDGCRIGLCENGSDDDSARVLADVIAAEGWGHVVSLTAISPNRGFTGGNNAVIDPVLAGDDTPDYVLLLNNDTLVIEGAFRELVAFMEGHPDVGVGGARMEEPDGTAQRAAFRFNGVLSEIESALHFGPVSRVLSRFVVAPPPPEKSERCDWVPGCGLIARREVVEAVGTLDEGYFTYFDDIDYCKAAKKAGWPTWYVYPARIVHLIGQTTAITDREKARKRRARFWFQARRRYYTKHHHPLHAAMIDLATLVFDPIGLALATVRGKSIDRPARYWRDFLSESVLVKGFRPPVVDNPALVGAREADTGVIGNDTVAPEQTGNAA